MVRLRIEIDFLTEEPRKDFTIEAWTWLLVLVGIQRDVWPILRDRLADLRQIKITRA